MSPAAVVPLEIRPATPMAGVLALMAELALLAGAGEEVRRQVAELTGPRSGEPCSTVQALGSVLSPVVPPASGAPAALPG